MNKQTAPSGDTISQIKDGLMTVKGLSDSLRRYGARDGVATASLNRRSSILRANQRAAGRLVMSALGQSNFDFKGLQAIQARSRLELNRMVQRQQEEAVKNSARVKAAFRAAAESQRRAIEASRASSVEAGQGFLQVLDEPFLIWPTNQAPELLLDTTEIEPWYSRATFKVDAESWGYTGVGFYFFWENPRNQWVTINVDAWLQFIGFGRVDVPLHWYDDEWSILSIQGRLTLLEWWNQPPTTAPNQAGQRQNVLDAEVDAYVGGPPIPISFVVATEGLEPVGNTGTMWGEPIASTCDLRYNLELVPPGGSLVIVVNVDVDWSNAGGGGIEADFDTAGYEVVCPRVIIQGLAAPVIKSP